MRRRDFFKVFSAAAAALAAGAASLSSAAPRRPVAVSANTEPLKRAVDDARETLLRLIKECRVMSWSSEAAIGDLLLYEVQYRRDPDAPLTGLDADVAAHVGHGVIRDATVEVVGDSVIHLGDYQPVPLEKPQYFVTVTYLVKGAQS
jgi:hypothetical protein